MNIEAVEREIGYTFKKKDLIITALTHSSYAQNTINNERLEFLGDAVLELVISEFLYKNLNVPEGRMTRLRANIVCSESLAKAAVEAHFGDHLRMGKGELSTGGKKRRSNLANVFEAVMGAIFLDSDYATVQEVILRLLKHNIELAFDGKLVKDYKTELQERIQKSPGRTIRYQDLEAKGPEHDQVFTAQVVIDNIPRTIGKGKTKKEAQQEAAKAFLRSNQI